jgi:hypothetical protein
VKKMNIDCADPVSVEPLDAEFTDPGSKNRDRSVSENLNGEGTVGGKTGFVEMILKTV